MRTIDVNEIDKIENPFVLDVREPEEIVATGSIKNAVNIPMNEVFKRLNEIPKDKDIYVLCRSGSRSKITALLLSGMGFKTVNLKGGIMNYKGKTFKLNSTE